jgi:hypothetical protein
VIPLFGRVPGRASGPSQSRIDNGGGLQYVSWKIDQGLMVFSLRIIYRWKGGIRRWARWPHHLVARPGARPRHPMVWLAPSSPSSLLWTPSRVRKNRNFGFCFINSENISYVAFLKHKNSWKKGNWHYGISLIG